MKKQLIGMSVCMMMLALIPVAAGMNCQVDSVKQCVESVDADTGLTKTFVRGIILRPRFTSRTISFGAVAVHYRVLGQGVSGMIRFPQRMSLDASYKGIVTGHFVCALFNGEPSI